MTRLPRHSYRTPTSYGYTVTSLDGYVERFDRAGNRIPSEPRGEDPFAEEPKPVPSLVSLRADVSRAWYATRDAADEWMVTQARKAIESAKTDADVTSEMRRAVANVGHLVRLAEQADAECTQHVCCSNCGHDSRLKDTREGRAFAENLGWREVAGVRLCPSCLTSTATNDNATTVPAVRKVRIQSRTRPGESHEVTLVFGRARECGCEAGRKKKRCWHLAAAEVAS